MRTTRTLPAVAMLICLVVSGAMAQDYAGPRLDGTVTLRSGEEVSGVILTAQLGIVDGAEIGSRLRDGGYIAVKVDGDERRIDATDIAAVDVEWAQMGTQDDPKWKIAQLSVTTQGGEVVIGQPAWLVHATSLIVETADGTQRKIYAFPMAGSNFSPENLMTSITLDATAAPVAEEPVAEEPAPAEPAADQPAPDQPVMDNEPAPEEPAPEEPAPEEPAPEEPAVVVEPVATPDVEVGMGIGQPTVEAVPEGTIFATGQPAVITFEVTNPATGEPMNVRFLIVPLPAE